MIFGSRCPNSSFVHGQISHQTLKTESTLGYAVFPPRLDLGIEANIEPVSLVRAPKGTYFSVPVGMRTCRLASSIVMSLIRKSSMAMPAVATCSCR